MEREKLEALLKEMTLEEKINQLFQLHGSFFEDGTVATGPAAEQGFSERSIQELGSVLGAIGADSLKRIQKNHMEKHPHQIPLLFMADIINGYKTIFPIPLAQGAAFNEEVARTGAEVAAREASAAGIHVTFSPMVDLVRDARWGRVLESNGEDVYLNSVYAKALVEGYQGDDPKAEGKIAACVKHFAAYGAPTAGRDYNNVELSERTLRDDYLPAYEAAIKAGALLVMTSFNTLNRIPSTANQWLMRKVLREEMGFQGVLISDWAAIEEIAKHDLAVDKKEAAVLALKAGTDIDMMTNCYCAYLKEAIEAGEVSEALLDEAVLRVLELKNKLGLFENPYKNADAEQEKKWILCEEHRRKSRKAAEETFVLLENDHMLPLKETERVAFIGPYVDEKKILGFWSIFGEAKDAV
ncbi:MAG: beta-glucosidase, partial [Lachnospiraceae bacterium]|nr:beta-glucosidase [Lachnospiraceae bacterium]